MCSVRRERLRCIGDVRALLSPVKRLGRLSAVKTRNQTQIGRERVKGARVRGAGHRSALGRPRETEAVCGAPRLCLLSPEPSAENRQSGVENREREPSRAEEPSTGRWSHGCPTFPLNSAALATTSRFSGDACRQLSQQTGNVPHPWHYRNSFIFQSAEQLIRFHGND